MRKLKPFTILLSLLLITATLSAQEDSPYKTHGIGLDLSYLTSGGSHLIGLGPSLMLSQSLNKPVRELQEEDRIDFWEFYAVAGPGWNRSDKFFPVTGIGLRYGNPIVQLGIDCMQLHGVMNEEGATGTDVRLGFEAGIMFLGYRFQYPLARKAEAAGMTRHAFFIRIPIPLKYF